MNVNMNEGFKIVQDIFKLKWIPEIIDSIASDCNRYSEIQDNIDYISHTELNRKLDVLQDKKVVAKISVEGKEGYYLTEFGDDLNHVFNHFVELSAKYVYKDQTIKLL